MKPASQKVAAIIVAAGASERMAGIDKVFARLAGRPVLARVIDVCQHSPAIDRIVVVVSQANLEKCRQLVAAEAWSKVVGVCAGGRRRQDSVTAGLQAVTDCHWVLIHDGARPFLTEALITNGLETAKETGAAIAAIPVTDTIKLTGDDLIVRETLPRDNLWSVQTPQVFRFDIISAAYQRITGDVTDDASLVEKLGYRVKVYPGAPENIKLTTPADLVLAEVLWQKYGQ